MVTMRHYARSAVFDHQAIQSYPDVMHLQLCVCGSFYEGGMWPGTAMESHMWGYIAWIRRIDCINISPWYVPVVNVLDILVNPNLPLSLWHIVYWAHNLLELCVRKELTRPWFESETSWWQWDTKCFLWPLGYPVISRCDAHVPVGIWWIVLIWDVTRNTDGITEV